MAKHIPKYQKGTSGKESYYIGNEEYKIDKNDVMSWLAKFPNKTKEDQEILAGLREILKDASTQGNIDIRNGSLWGNKSYNPYSVNAFNYFFKNYNPYDPESDKPAKSKVTIDQLYSNYVADTQYGAKNWDSEKHAERYENLDKETEGTDGSKTRGNTNRLNLIYDFLNTLNKDEYDKYDWSDTPFTSYDELKSRLDRIIRAKENGTYDTEDTAALDAIGLSREWYTTFKQKQEQEEQSGDSDKTEWKVGSTFTDGTTEYKVSNISDGVVTLQGSNGKTIYTYDDDEHTQIPTNDDGIYIPQNRFADSTHYGSIFYKGKWYTNEDEINNSELNDSDKQALKTSLSRVKSQYKTVDLSDIEYRQFNPSDKVVSISNGEGPRIIDVQGTDADNNTTWESYLYDENSSSWKPITIERDAEKKWGYKNGEGWVDLNNPIEYTTSFTAPTYTYSLQNDALKNWTPEEFTNWSKKVYALKDDDTAKVWLKDVYDNWLSNYSDFTHNSDDAVGITYDKRKNYYSIRNSHKYTNIPNFAISNSGIIDFPNIKKKGGLLELRKYQDGGGFSSKEEEREMRKRAAAQERASISIPRRVGGDQTSMSITGNDLKGKGWDSITGQGGEINDADRDRYWGAIADVAGLAVSFIPVIGNVVGGASGLFGTYKNIAADIHDVNNGSLRGWEAVKNATVNLGLDAATLGAGVAGKMGKAARAIQYLASTGALFNLWNQIEDDDLRADTKTAFNHLVNLEFGQISTDQWRKIAAVLGGVRMARNAVKTQRGQKAVLNNLVGQKSGKSKIKINTENGTKEVEVSDDALRRTVFKKKALKDDIVASIKDKNPDIGDVKPSDIQLKGFIWKGVKNSEPVITERESGVRRWIGKQLLETPDEMNTHTKSYENVPKNKNEIIKEYFDNRDKITIEDMEKPRKWWYDNGERDLEKFWYSLDKSRQTSQSTTPQTPTRSSSANVSASGSSTSSTPASTSSTPAPAPAPAPAPTPVSTPVSTSASTGTSQSSTSSSQSRKPLPAKSNNSNKNKSKKKKKHTKHEEGGILKFVDGGKTLEDFYTALDIATRNGITLSNGATGHSKDTKTSLYFSTKPRDDDFFLTEENGKTYYDNYLSWLGNSSTGKFSDLNGLTKEEQDLLRFTLANRYRNIHPNAEFTDAIGIGLGRDNKFGPNHEYFQTAYLYGLGGTGDDSQLNKSYSDARQTIWNKYKDDPGFVNWNGQYRATFGHDYWQQSPEAQGNQPSASVSTDSQPVGQSAQAAGSRVENQSTVNGTGTSSTENGSVQSGTDNSSIGNIESIPGSKDGSYWRLDPVTKMNMINLGISNAQNLANLRRYNDWNPALYTPNRELVENLTDPYFLAKERALSDNYRQGQRAGESTSDANLYTALMLGTSQNNEAIASKYDEGMKEYLDALRTRQLANAKEASDNRTMVFNKNNEVLSAWDKDKRETINSTYKQNVNNLIDFNKNLGLTWDQVIKGYKSTERAKAESQAYSDFMAEYNKIANDTSLSTAQKEIALNAAKEHYTQTLSNLDAQYYNPWIWRDSKYEGLMDTSYWETDKPWAIRNIFNWGRRNK